MKRCLSNLAVVLDYAIIWYLVREQKGEFTVGSRCETYQFNSDMRIMNTLNNAHVRTFTCAVGNVEISFRKAIGV